MSAFGKLAWLLCAGGFVAAWYYQAQPGQTQAAFMAFLDVGQGDATYIRTSTGSDIFIDGGPDRTILERAPEVMQPFDTTIETLILTHPDADHITGMVELVKRYDVQQIVTTALPATKPLHIELLGLIKQKQIQHVIVSAGDHLQFDSTTTCTVLYPSGTIQELSQQEIGQHQQERHIEYEYGNDKDISIIKQLKEDKFRQESPAGFDLIQLCIADNELQVTECGIIKR